MLQPLLQLLAEKKDHYGGAGTGFDHLCLVVYYNQALYYNSPVETPSFGFDGMVAAAAQFLEGDPDPLGLACHQRVTDGRGIPPYNRLAIFIC